METIKEPIIHKIVDTSVGLQEFQERFLTNANNKE